ncbi:hypothetical protein BTJ68_03721 [Hortaea werneckii EXF-2000]|uniref:RPEL repeat protein n=1 Tax=Hortaea werneckii EXF-2000 TaxID=1157616 RepID=A0A1Z5TLM4_HORWE|nr:hypothetical protein BTJ68_03721 [Hortaea werneckii EXF-2000]
MATYQPPTDRTPSTTTTENNDATVDTAPITTNTLERRNSLEKGLAHRPEKEELVERNILAGGPAAPALQEKQRELEKHMRADSLEKQLSNRPKPEDLVKEGILNGLSSKEGGRG